MSYIHQLLSLVYHILRIIIVLLILLINKNWDSCITNTWLNDFLAILDVLIIEHHSIDSIELIATSCNLHLLTRLINWQIIRILIWLDADYIFWYSLNTSNASFNILRQWRHSTVVVTPENRLIVLLSIW